MCTHIHTHVSMFTKHNTYPWERACALTESESESERGREKERQRERQKERQRERERESARASECVCERENTRKSERRETFMYTHANTSLTRGSRLAVKSL